MIFLEHMFYLMFFCNQIWNNCLYCGLTFCVGKCLNPTSKTIASSEYVIQKCLTRCYFKTPEKSVLKWAIIRHTEEVGGGLTNCIVTK